MNIRFAVVLAISILMLLTVAGCCCPIPFPLDNSSPSTNVPSSSSSSSKPAATTNATEFTWMSDLSAGLQKASAEGKPVLLDFWGGG